MATQTVTVNEQTAIEHQAQQVVRIAGNIHGFGTPPSTPAPTPAGSMPTTGGNVLGNGPASNPLLQGLAQERMQRMNPQPAAGGRAALPLAPANVTASPTQSTAAPQPLGIGLGQDTPTLRTRSGSPDPGPPGAGASTVTERRLDLSALQALLRQLLEQRRLLLAKLWVLVETWQNTPLMHLDGVLEAFSMMQAQMQSLEFRIAGQIASGSGPPGDPRRGGSQTTAEEGRPTLRITTSPSRIRFRQAMGALQLLQDQLLLGQQRRAQSREAFAASIQAFGPQLQPAPSAGWQAMVQGNQNFINALAALTNNPPPIQPTQTWREIMLGRADFLNAVQAMTLNQPPARPTLAWQGVEERGAQRPLRFANALQALNLHPPPPQPTPAWHAVLARMQHRAHNFQIAMARFAAHPPLPLLQPPAMHHVNHAPAAYAVPAAQAQHILHGNHGGGQHMGMFNPGLHGAPPNAITQFHFVGHHVTYFPVAWTAQDILDAVIEGAEATYHLAVYQHATGRWRHPAIRITRRGISVSIIVITSAHHGNLNVHTAWPQ